MAVLIKFITSQNEFINTKIRIFSSFIIAGGISNTIDRIFRGYVVEFIDFKYLPVLNIADFFIVLGWLCFVLVFINFAIHEIRSNKRKNMLKNNLIDKDKKTNTKDNKKTKNNNTKSNKSNNKNNSKSKKENNNNHKEK